MSENDLLNGQGSFIQPSRQLRGFVCAVCHGWEVELQILRPPEDAKSQLEVRLLCLRCDNFISGRLAQNDNQ